MESTCGLVRKAVILKPYHSFVVRLLQEQESVHEGEGITPIKMISKMPCNVPQYSLGQVSGCWLCGHKGGDQNLEYYAPGGWFGCICYGAIFSRLFVGYYFGSLV